MYRFSARFTRILGLFCILAGKCASWVQPQISIQPGFLNIYSTSDNFVHGSNLVIGQPYTLDIRMTGTDRYDYLLQRCTYNDKYHFIDQNSCLVCDNFFQKMWENDMYQLQNAFKRTIVHFIPPEPLVRLDCSVRVLECCGCAERACGRNILPALATYPQQVINLAIINEPAGTGFFSFASWPWWAWLLLILGLILLLCLIPLLLLLCSRFFMRKRKVIDSKPVISRTAPTEAPNILAREKELEANGIPKVDSRRPPIPPPPPTRVYRTPSESPSASAQSTASRSRAAVVVKQSQQPRAHWVESAMRSGMEMRRSASEQQMGTRHLERVNEEREQVTGYQDVTESGSRYQSGAVGGYRAGYLSDADSTRHASSVPAQMMHQQTTSEEKFFKKDDRRRGFVEEGYDRAQVTYTTPATHYSHSEIV